jgi:hypothetical protein
MKNRKCIIDIETTDFIPWKGKIICIGIMNLNNNIITVFQNYNEKQIIKDFLTYFNKNKFTSIIGYNISYDQRYILSKCMKYNIPAKKFLQAKYIDIMKVLKGIDSWHNYNKPGTLNQWSYYLLNDFKMFNNKDIPLLYYNGKINEIIEYNKKDLELTNRIWDKIQIVLENNISRKSYFLF